MNFSTCAQDTFKNLLVNRAIQNVIVARGIPNASNVGKCRFTLLPAALAEGLTKSNFLTGGSNINWLLLALLFREVVKARSVTIVPLPENASNIWLGLYQEFQDSNSSPLLGVHFFNIICVRKMFPSGSEVRFLPKGSPLVSVCSIRLRLKEASHGCARNSAAKFLSNERWQSPLDFRELLQGAGASSSSAAISSSTKSFFVSVQVLFVSWCVGCCHRITYRPFCTAPLETFQ